MRKWAVAATLMSVASACAAGSDEAPGDDDDDDGGPGGSVSSTATGGGGMGGNPSASTVSVGVGGAGGGGDVDTEVFGHSGATLFRLDPVTNDITAVADFSGCNDANILDIALDRDSTIFAVSRRGLFRVDRTTAACTEVNEFPGGGQEYPDSLAFVPAGTLDPTEEALVGYEGDDYVRIDTTTGAISVVTTNALGNGLISSGDIVSVIDGPTYLTVKNDFCSCSDSCPPDRIVQVDPADGRIVADFGTVDYPNVFGVSFWAGDVFGFSCNGELFRVTFGDSSVTTNLINFPSAPPGLAFFGAGSSTAAPVAPPR
ncbi:MAG: hypothetical protein AAF715_15070 [Myxococcota bacterium]